MHNGVLLPHPHLFAREPPPWRSHPPGPQFASIALPQPGRDIRLSKDLCKRSRSTPQASERTTKDRRPFASWDNPSIVFCLSSTIVETVIKTITINSLKHIRTILNWCAEVACTIWKIYVKIVFRVVRLEIQGEINAGERRIQDH